MTAPLDLSRVPLDALLDERERQVCRRLSSFIRRSWHVHEPGTAYKHNWHVDLVSEVLEAITAGQLRNVVINEPPRHMKLCADDTPIPTPDGWRRHGDIAAGDRVFGPDGTPTRVLAISPKGAADYAVVFHGERILCNGDHLWTVWDRWARQWKTLDTATLAALPLRGTNPGKGDGTRARFFLPETACLQWPEADLPLDPYFLGCWLGDGTSSKPAITHDPQDTAHIIKLATRGYHVARTHRTGPERRSVCAYFSHQGIVGHLRSLGVFRAKHIPEVYQQASEAQRLELLAGLIDTDGYIEQRTGRVTIASSNARLARDVERLVFSLGFRAFTQDLEAPGYQEYAPTQPRHYRVSFQATRSIPTALARKAITRYATLRQRPIERIERVPAEVGHCLTVDRPDGLYVVGRTHLVTHNSIQVTIAWPVWEWATFDAHLRYIFSSYAQSLSMAHSVKRRGIIESPWFQKLWGIGTTADIVLAADDNQKLAFANTKTGRMEATSMMGAVTGKGGTRIIIDDPHNPTQALSEKERQNHLEFFGGTLLNRRDDPEKSAVVIVMQRLHDKDLTGHAVSELGYEHVVLKAEDGPRARVFIKGLDRAWERDESGLLWPDRFNKPVLDEMRVGMGSKNYAAQYQQTPVPDGGGTFKREWYRRVQHDVAPEEIAAEVRYWDCASTKDGGCYSVGTRMAKLRNGRYLIRHVVRGQWSPGELHAKIVQFAHTDGGRVWVREEEEGGSSGAAVINFRRQHLRGFNYDGFRQTGTKESRWEAFAVVSEAGQIDLLESPWTEDWLREMELIPAGTYKDQADSASDAFLLLSGRGTARMVQVAGV